MRLLAAALALSSGLVMVPPAHAEWFAGLYLGYAITAPTELTFTTRTPRTFEDVEFQNSVVWGGRAGYWFGAGDTWAGTWTPYLGFDLDVSYFRPRIPTQTTQTNVGRARLGGMDVTVVTVTPEILWRYPLMVDQEFPTGRLQPYFGFGPTIFYSSSGDSTSFGPRGSGESDTGLGVAFRPGVAWQVTEAVSVFAEYRFVHISPTYEFPRGPVDLSINSHQFNVGAAYRFGR
jgi:opacity protein-like surface antigen